MNRCNREMNDTEKKEKAVTKEELPGVIT